jgi:hypothetical protein
MTGHRILLPGPETKNPDQVTGVFCFDGCDLSGCFVVLDTDLFVSLDHHFDDDFHFVGVGLRNLAPFVTIHCKDVVHGIAPID